MGVRVRRDYLKGWVEFSNFSWKENHLEACLKCKIQKKKAKSRTPRNSDPCRSLHVQLESEILMQMVCLPRRGKHCRRNEPPGSWKSGRRPAGAHLGCGRCDCTEVGGSRLEFPREIGLILRCAGKAGNPFQTTQGQNCQISGNSFWDCWVISRADSQRKICDPLCVPAYITL